MEIGRSRQNHFPFRASRTFILSDFWPKPGGLGAGLTVTGPAGTSVKMVCLARKNETAMAAWTKSNINPGCLFAATILSVRHLHFEGGAGPVEVYEPRFFTYHGPFQYTQGDGGFPPRPRRNNTLVARVCQHCTGARPGASLCSVLLLNGIEKHHQVVLPRQFSVGISHRLSPQREKKERLDRRRPSSRPKWA